MLRDVGLAGAVYVGGAEEEEGVARACDRPLADRKYPPLQHAMLVEAGFMVLGLTALAGAVMRFFATTPDVREVLLELRDVLAAPQPVFQVI